MSTTMYRHVITVRLQLTMSPRDCQLTGWRRWHTYIYIIVCIEWRFYIPRTYTVVTKGILCRLSRLRARIKVPIDILIYDA